MKNLKQEFYSMVNIAYLRFCLDTLGENFIYEEEAYLKGYSPTVLCGLTKRVDRKIDYFCHSEFVQLYHPKWPVFSPSQKDVYHKGMLEYHDIIKQKDIKLIHAQFLTDAFFCYQLIKESSLPLIVNLRGYDLFHPKIKSFLSVVEPSVSKFIVKSASMKQELISHGVESDKINVIYGGINTDKIVFKPRVPIKNNIKILSSGRFVDKKGYDTTLKFFCKLVKSYSNAELTLIGEGELKINLETMINRLGIASKVTIKEYMSHDVFLKELYKHNLFVLPSQTAKNGDKEGIPNVLKEAMASGMPVISTNHSGIPELITDQETGYLVDENDYAGILDKVNFILNNNEKVFEVCLNARFFIEKYFDVRKTAKQVEQLYDYLLMPKYAKSALDVKNGKKPSEFRVDLHLNEGCNSKCIMCDDWKNNLSTFFSRDDISKILEKLKSFGVNHVRFHGQEPTLLKDIFLVMKEAKDKGFRVGLKTNALIFSTEKKVKMLKGIIDDLYLSIDSSDEDIHNLLRGNKRSFSRNMYLANTIRKYIPDIPIYFNSVVTGKNYKFLPGMLDLANSMNANRVSFVHLSTNNKEDIDKLRLTKEQFKDFYFNIWPRILKKSMDYNIYVSVDPYFTSLVSLPVIMQIKKLLQSPEDFNEEIDNFVYSQYGKKFYSQNTCYGVLDHGTIDWEGNVFACCAMPRSRETAIGNILKDSYTNIWNSKKYVKYRESILKGECKYKNQCSRAFKQINSYNTYFKNQHNGSSDPLVEDFMKQFKDNKHTDKYYLDKIIYYSSSQSKLYKDKFKEFIESRGKMNTSMLPFITKEEIKNVFPDKDALPNYFEEDYGIYKTSSCDEKLFEYAKPLTSNRFARMSTAFIHTKKWSAGQPWLKLTPLNCIEAQYASKTVSSSVEYKEKHSSIVIVVPPSDNFIDAPLSQIKNCYELIKNSNTCLIHANPNHLKTLLYRFYKEGIKLNDHYAVNSTYEILLPSTKKLIEQYFDCQVFDQYGCSEVGPISFRCRYGSNHLFSDTVHIDVVPAIDLNRPDIGRVVVTDLKNYVMPFVRYFNGDFAYVLKNEKCKCDLKSPIMGDIVGREVEMINYKGKVVFPLELDSLFYDLDNILMYQVIFQNEQFNIKLVLIEKSEEVKVIELTNRFKKYFGDNALKVSIEEVYFILPKSGGKYSTTVIDNLVLTE